MTYASEKQLEELRKNDSLNRYQIKALKYNIGINPISHFSLNEQKTFRENVILFKRKIILFKKKTVHTNWKIQFAVKKDSSSSEQETNLNFVDKTEIKKSFRKNCKACKNSIAAHEIKRCAKCHMSYYCSKECQIKDWKVHKTDCNLVE